MVDYCTECNGSNCMKWSNNGFTKFIGSFIFKGAESCSKYSDSNLSLFLSIMSFLLFILIPINICFGIVKRDKDILLIPLIVTLSMILINIYKSFNFTFMERPFQTSINEQCTSDEDSDEMKEKYKCAKSSGMPSGHASASIIFIIASVLIAINSHGQGNFDWQYILLLLINIFVSLFAIYSRYELKYHTILQIGTGIFVGAIIAVLYGYLGNKQDKPDIRRHIGPESVSVLQLFLAFGLMGISYLNRNDTKEFLIIFIIYMLALVTWFFKFKYHQS